jgi:aspartate dehydrogenase
MNVTDRHERIAMVGFGAIGQRVYRALHGNLTNSVLGVLVRSRADDARKSVDGSAVFENVEQLLAWRPTLVVECASHDAVATVAPRVLAAGVDMIIASIGALSNEDVQKSLTLAASQGNARLTVVSGAVGGLDALNAARLGRLDTVTYVGRKHPAAWRGSPAESEFDLHLIKSPTTVFSGNAMDAARLYPKNANVTASVALAGVGFRQTRVDLIADPGVTQNIHEVHAAGAFGSLSFVITNNALPENPKTSMLAALSIEAKVRMRSRPIVF